MIKLVRYFFVGGAAALVDFAVFAALVKIAQWPWYFAAAASFTWASFVNYWLSVWFVFSSGSRFKRVAEITLVFLVSGVGLGVNQISLYALVVYAGLNVFIAKIGATGVVFFWNFFARHQFVFRDSPKKTITNLY